VLRGADTDRGPRRVRLNSALKSAYTGVGAKFVDITGAIGAYAPRVRQGAVLKRAG
jgi:hypothetical protein